MQEPWTTKPTIQSNGKTDYNWLFLTPWFNTLAPIITISLSTTSAIAVNPTTSPPYQWKIHTLLTPSTNTRPKSFKICLFVHGIESSAICLLWILSDILWWWHGCVCFSFNIDFLTTNMKSLLPGLGSGRNLLHLQQVHCFFCNCSQNWRRQCLFICLGYFDTMRNFVCA